MSFLDESSRVFLKALVIILSSRGIQDGPYTYWYEHPECRGTFIRFKQGVYLQVLPGNAKNFPEWLIGYRTFKDGQMATVTGSHHGISWLAKCFGKIALRTASCIRPFCRTLHEH